MCSSDLTRMPTCGSLADCIGNIAGHSEFWDLSLVAVPRSGQQVPCVGNPLCDVSGSCFP